MLYETLTEPLVALARATVDRLVDDWRARYGDVVIDVSITAADPDRVRVAGYVLVPSQRDALARALSGAFAASGAGPDALQLAVDSLTARAEPVAWAVPAYGRAAVRARPDAAADLATELVDGDPPARVLAYRGAWSAVELADRSVGWMAADDMTAADAPGTVDAWRAAWAGRARGVPADDWQRAAAAWLHVPYVLGGNSRHGVDCSGLSQRLYRAVLGIGLPKHSADQARFGERVARSALAAGDLLHLTHVERGTSHVAVVAESTPPRVVHASLEHGAVVIEPLDALLARYVLRAARRFPPGSTAVCP